MTTEQYYKIAYYDSFDDSWSGVVDRIESLDEAKRKCDELMTTLPEGNKKCGEHYSVWLFSDELIREVYRPTRVF